VLDVLIVRHAIAADRDAEAWPDDSLRPLTERGEDRFRQAARGLARLVPTVDAVLASPYVRAWRTAELLRDEAGWPEPERCEELEAERPPSGLLEALDARSGSVALVGHEPFLSSLASLLLTGEENRLQLVLKKGGALLVRRTSSSAELVWHLTPKVLRALPEPPPGRR
jgi:phosphohistidine phosphatase